MLSIIMPVFNEVRTFDKALQQVIKQKVGMKKEILIVESNSTDGTREAVLQYAVGKGKPFTLRDGEKRQQLTQYKGKKIGDSQITILLEKRPQGKGHALKSGFQIAKGEIILIQDGDTEYKTSEYPKLLQPILDGKTAFVLGSRHAHGSTWKIRKMHNGFYAMLVNFGHLAYTTLFNILYGVHLTDPATMFKVFRRDAASGITWRSNYFELDWEIVAKLIRKGHRPIEIPVSYNSRTNEEGKKIRFLRDGFLVFWSIVSFRFRPL
ncbi:MAG: glycosyltransferase family 2 protein [Candidatus Woesearchaeota archaeon]|nr:glycosyltransferase family 2 protein [Candidatus Woesearchaeota archaeon]